MVSTLTAKNTRTTVIAMERGAVDFVTKPTNIIEAKGEDFKKRLLSVLKAVLVSQQENCVNPVRPVRMAACIYGCKKKSAWEQAGGARLFYRRTEGASECHPLSGGQYGRADGAGTAYAGGIYKVYG